jgi:hypothetical protein
LSSNLAVAHSQIPYPTTNKFLFSKRTFLDSLSKNIVQVALSQSEITKQTHFSVFAILFMASLIHKVFASFHH